MKTLRPAELHQVIPADFFSTEALLKFGQAARVILHSPSHYPLGLHESSAYLDASRLIGGTRKAALRDT